MKFFLIFSLLFVSLYSGQAQNTKRNINFRTIDKDSVSLPLNDEYYLIEDSCAQIIRNSRFNFETRKFYGKFTDVSKASPGLIVSEGTYSENGLKNGLFTAYYLNGKLRAKGNFKNDKYDGKWEMYYEDGKPELTFEVVNGDCHIIDAWKPDGTKTVDNGNGIYKDDFGGMYWIGKLINGKPDGKWNLIRTDDISNTPFSTERFKKGEFKDGATGDINYDASRISLVSPFKLPLVNAEKMLVSIVPCNGAQPKHIIGAQYEDGLKVFSGYLSDMVSPYLSKLNIKGINATIEITGEVSENGTIINLDYNRPDIQNIARGLTGLLRNLPRLHPATVDGKPVKQKFTISFKIYDNLYQFTYRFLPVQVN